jgi:hypothetical protein
MIVLAAIVGPPLIGHRVPALAVLRHDVLMLDREFDRWVLTDTSSRRTEASRDV